MRLRVSEEVKHALENNLPVVALESTIISHGMPYPKNVETALLVEKTIRDNGAIPATIGITEGECIVEDTMDISADLQELARTNVCVICAGAKAILDLPRTLEYLETMGVPVLGYGVEELPAFYSRESGLKVDYRVDSGLEVAKILKEKWDMNLNGGVLVTNPIPHEYSYDFKEMEKIIDKAMVEMRKQGIKGKDTTPFLLAYIKELTGGNSLESNIALVLNNAVVGAGIAKEFVKL